jgi:hypothetical protein
MVLFGDRFVIYTAQIWRVVDFLQFVFLQYRYIILFLVLFFSNNCVETGGGLCFDFEM